MPAGKAPPTGVILGIGLRAIALGENLYSAYHESHPLGWKDSG